MSGKGRGRSSGRDRGRRSQAARGSNYAISKKSKGLCTALGDHVFDYGQKGAADQVKSSYRTLVRHVGTLYGPDIANELENRKTRVIPKPEYTQDVLDEHDNLN